MNSGVNIVGYWRHGLVVVCR